MINATATRTSRDRRVTYSWEGPAIEDEKDPGWNECIQLVISHNKDGKCYTATLYKVAIGKRDTYSMIRYEVFADTNRAVTRIGIGGYSHFITP